MGENKNDIFSNLLFSCACEKYRSDEQILPEHFLAIHLSGETHMQITGKNLVFKEGSIILVRKNQLFRAVKIPGSNGEYKAVAIFLNEDVLRKYASLHRIPEQERYIGESTIIIKKNPFIQGYFKSLLPYEDSTIKKTHSLSDIKINEAIELLLQYNPDFKKFLFDFSKLHKIDIEKFMLQNYKSNVPIEQFAKLTGRSLASFKRDFKKTFGQSPRQWLQGQRLTEAHRLITKENQKPTDIYLDLGFENLSHFYFSFKQKYGVTPTELK
ncbi:AraC family transcriptional regulator [Chryseobacterium sp. Bi04]|uniref:helix-turn-helix domain-containing protein n=1 Tax=Chryseobacterium sp. Bi04 TaxID=2822345 RepID=UPI001D3E8A27|nr:AraC family transcriptional regulator [Chryseobacterium sp. Bi04]CAH0168710.1 Exoenzyme S synthesis regulatory protein ExsA [Chryseobacterium sp. Bi04]